MKPSKTHPRKSAARARGSDDAAWTLPRRRAGAAAESGSARVPSCGPGSDYASSVWLLWMREMIRVRKSAKNHVCGRQTKDIF